MVDLGGDGKRNCSLLCQEFDMPIHLKDVITYLQNCQNPRMGYHSCILCHYCCRSYHSWCAMHTVPGRLGQELAPQMHI